MTKKGDAGSANDGARSGSVENLDSASTQGRHAEERARPASRSTLPVTRLALLAYALAAAWVVADQSVKAWVVGPLHLPDRAPIEILPGLFRLTMVWNRGVSYGLLNGTGGQLVRWSLSLFSAAVAVGLAVWARRSTRLLPAVALGLVMGGAVGNLIDRVRLGAVIDFLDFSGLHFPWVFNVADSGISIGVALLLLDSLIAPKPTAAA